MGPGRLQTQKEASGKSWHQYLIHYKWNFKTKEKLVAVDEFAMSKIQNILPGWSAAAMSRGPTRSKMQQSQTFMV